MRVVTSFLLISAFLVGGSHARAASAADTLVVVVRHAEKAGGEAMAMMDADPPLAEAGKARAVALADSLAHANVRAVYSTDYTRTRETAKTLAERTGIEVATYDAKEAPVALAKRLTAAHRGETIVIVGHSNTVPSIVAAFADVDVPPIPDDEYDRYYVISIAPDGAARVVSAGYPER